MLKALQDIIAEFWEEYEYPDRAPKQSPTVEAIRKAEHVIRRAKRELVTDVLGEFSRLCQKRDLAAYRAVAAIQTVVLFWEAQDYDDVLAQLQKALADFKGLSRSLLGGVDRRTSRFGRPSPILSGALRPARSERRFLRVSTTPRYFVRQPRQAYRSL